MENIIVIGGGLMGSSVAWQLVNYGEQLLLLEQLAPKSIRRSSYGQARISRSLGEKKDVFSFVQQKTIEETKKLLRYLNGHSPVKRHKMKDIYSTSPVSYLYPKSQQEEVDKLLHKKQKDKYKKAASDAAFRKFGVSVPDDSILIREYKKYSGVMNPAALISKLQLGIKKKGSKIQYNAKVVKIKKQQGFYEVTVLNTKTGEKKIVKTRKIVVAAGPYLPSLLKRIAPYFDKLISPKRVPLFFFKIKKKRFNCLSKKEKKNIVKAHPFFNQNGKMFFSMIEKMDTDGQPLFKAGGHFLRANITDLDRVWAAQPRKKELKWTKKQFRKYLEMLEIYVEKKEIELVKSHNCVYAMSKTKVPFITNILTRENTIDPNMVVIGGMSGIGAKGCLSYGLLAADLLLDLEDSSIMYKKAKKALGSPLLRLNTKLKSKFKPQ